MRESHSQIIIKIFLPPLKDFASFLWQFTRTYLHSWVERDSVRSNFIYLTQAQALPPPQSPFQDFASFPWQFTGTHLYSWVERCSMRSTFIYLKQAQAQALAPHPPLWDFACFPWQFTWTHLYFWVERGNVRVKYSILLNPVTPKIRLLILPFSC